MSEIKPTNNQSEKNEASEGLTFEQVKELMSVMNKEGVTHFKMGQGASKLSISRKNSIVQLQPENTQMSVSSELSDCPKDFREDSSSSIEEKVSTGHAVTSPVVGVFYDSPAPDQDPYVSVGDYVDKGDVLCIVEAMKLMNEVASPVSGVVTEICAQRAQRVEYGQSLFYIEPGAQKGDS